MNFQQVIMMIPTAEFVKLPKRGTLKKDDDYTIYLNLKPFFTVI